MRIAGITHDSLVDGPGLRVVIFVQGCDLGCPNCHNPESWPTTGGKDYTVREVMRLMKRGRGKKITRGVTFSGGEPFLQAGDLAQIAFEAKLTGWDVTTYTGYTFEELSKRTEDTDVQALLNLTDYLIDGPYIHEQRDLDLKFRGSANQRIIDMETTRRQNGRVKLYYGV